MAPNLLLNWISCPVEAQCTFFSCFLKSRPLCDQTGPNRGSRAVFAWLYGWLYWQGFYRALDLFQKQLRGSNSMQLRIRFLVTLIKTPLATLFPSFYRCLLALQKTLSGLHNWQDDYGVDCWLYEGYHKWQHENGWLTFVWQNLKISGQVFKRPKRLHHKIFLAKADLPGSFCRQLWWTLWNGQWDKVKVGKHTPTRQFLQGCLPYQPPTNWQTVTYSRNLEYLPL